MKSSKTSIVITLWSLGNYMYLILKSSSLADLKQLLTACLRQSSVDCLHNDMQMGPYPVNHCSAQTRAGPFPTLPLMKIRNLFKHPAQTLCVQTLDVESVFGLCYPCRFRVSTAGVLQISHHFAVFRERYHMAVGFRNRPH